MPLRNSSELGIHPDRGVWTQVPGGRPDGRYGGDLPEIPAYHKPLVEEAHDEPARKSARMQRAGCATRMHQKHISKPSLYNPLVLKVQAFLAAHKHREMGAALLAIGGGTVHHLQRHVRDNAQSTVCTVFDRVHARDTRYHLPGETVNAPPDVQGLIMAMLVRKCKLLAERSANWAPLRSISRVPRFLPRCLHHARDCA